MKMVNETRKILGDPELALTATCVRVPVQRGHGEVMETARGGAHHRAATDSHSCVLEPSYAAAAPARASALGSLARCAARKA